MSNGSGAVLDGDRTEVGIEVVLAQRARWRPAFEGHQGVFVVMNHVRAIFWPCDPALSLVTRLHSHPLGYTFRSARDD